MEASHLRNVTEILARKWDLVILTHLTDGPMRYTQLAQAIRKDYPELTEGVLSKTLRRLTDDRMVHKVAFGKSRRAHDLTTEGRAIVSVLAQISAIYENRRQPPMSPPEAGVDDPLSYS
ncbi:winged helix-turn-helix transcriptional regulator [Dactylosporangium sp. NBC_01737]|uniref:winged helix-turn-helix transcriptional regulator n=1 Tax=Dactylosporangium sp. NBC_01737 TaxID=2975959 RepID=UPI002E11389D|nr:winged helix-turn-helix transcriptional regulator [Dactylosporangium sp. NBC_01737]